MIEGIRFGACAPTIEEQLDGVEYDVLEIGHCQRLNHAANDLWIAGMLTDKEITTVRKRLGKRIFAAINE